MNYTKNFKFKKPEQNEFYEIDDINGNFDTLDALISHRNILDNAYFPHAVNQRAFKAHAAENNYATIDRWKGYGNVKYEDVVQLTAAQGATSYIYQYIEFPDRLTGKDLTLSVRYKTAKGSSFTIAASWYDTAWHNAAKTLEASSDWIETSLTFKIESDAAVTGLHVRIGVFKASGTSWNPATEDCDISFEWVKLEHGGYKTAFEIPSYTDELRKCQRHYIKYDALKLVGVGNGSTMYVNLPLPEPMRAKPAATSSPACTVDSMSGNIVTLAVSSSVNGAGLMTFNSLELSAEV